MAVKIIDLKCSNCGSPLSPSQSTCEYCGGPVVVTSFNSVYAQELPTLNKLTRALDKDLREGNSPELSGNIKFTLGGCYLKLKLYDKALQRFEEAIEENFDNPEAPFYAAVSLLKGKKAFLTPMANIKKAIEYVDAALMVEDRGVFHYFLAYIKFDFYARKYLRISPDWREELQSALATNLSPTDCDMLFDILAVPRPPELNLFDGSTV